MRTSLSSRGKGAAAGRVIFLAAAAGLGLVEAAARTPLPGLHQFEATGTAAIAIGAAMVVLAALGLTRQSASAFLALALLWLGALVLAGAAAASAPRDPANWVAPAELLAFAVASLRLAAEASSTARPIAQTLLRLAAGGLLLLFGSVHLTRQALIISLIPAWTPWREAWPYVTGPALCLAGFALLVGSAVMAAKLAVAGMFASWLILVHAQRIYEAPSDTFEWTFALTALALVGIMLMVSPRASDA